MRYRKNADVLAIKSGVTLIELLIVMGILTILATISLGTVKGLLKDQKITQAARLVEQYIETARVRALTSGRPVAVFIERVGMTGVGGNAVPSNYTATRLSIGEVFPPYGGDSIGTKGVLVDVLMPSVPARNFLDGHADEIVFNRDEVVSGFGLNGTDGFIQPGDTIEFEGFDGRFSIESIRPDTTTTPNKMRVSFFNPPASYNANRGLLPHYGSPTSLPINPAHPPEVGFRVYRRPTKSLVGAITLPRGTCIDLSASGLGPGSAGAGDLMATSPFSLTHNASSATTAPAGPATTVRPGSYSRIAVLFSGEGRLSAVIPETKLLSGPAFDQPQLVEAGQILYLLVGRTDQVVPGETANRQQLKQSILQRSLPSSADPITSNLLDSGNIWISCNPFTGEIKSGPVAEVSESAIEAARAELPTLNVQFQRVVRAARSLAIAGIREQ